MGLFVFRSKYMGVVGCDYCEYEMILDFFFFVYKDR